MASKTYGFEEAVKLLAGGKCKGIKLPEGNFTLTLGPSGLLNAVLDTGHLVSWPVCPHQILMQWFLIDPQPEVLLTGFLNIYKDNACFHLTEEGANRSRNASRLACIPFTYSRPFEG